MRAYNKKLMRILIVHYLKWKCIHGDVKIVHQSRKNPFSVMMLVLDWREGKSGNLLISVLQYMQWAHLQLLQVWLTMRFFSSPKAAQSSKSIQEHCRLTDVHNSSSGSYLPDEPTMESSVSFILPLGVHSLDCLDDLPYTFFFIISLFTFLLFLLDKLFQDDTRMIQQPGEMESPFMKDQEPEKPKVPLFPIGNCDIKCKADKLTFRGYWLSSNINQSLIISLR